MLTLKRINIYCFLIKYCKLFLNRSLDKVFKLFLNTQFLYILIIMYYNILFSVYKFNVCLYCLDNYVVLQTTIPAILLVVLISKCITFIIIYFVMYF